MNRKKRAAALAAVLSATLVLLGGTFAWQSISQTALNEAADVINPGGRLHDDFDGENKDVYVENFADEPIFARIQLSEYMALINNKGVEGAEKEHAIIGGTSADGKRIYETHYYGEDQQNRSDVCWTWTMGGSTVYMPTFNKNKDSLVAEQNGTYLGPDGIVTEEKDDDRYQDYHSYELGEEETGTEIYDGDANDVDEVKDDFDNLTLYEASGSIILERQITHQAKQTLEAEWISMTDWLGLVETAGGYDPEQHGNYWVYDRDGWVYWSAPIMPETATGLLLDRISRQGVVDDSWYYVIQVTAQFVTAEDSGKADHSGFYDTGKGTEPTENAEMLLQLIGVEQ